MKIGNVETKNNVFLAPMAGITDLPFRIICAEHGAGLVYGEMVSAKGIYYGNENTKAMLQADKAQGVCAMQLFGSDPQVLAKMTAEIEGLDFDVIDINMGCPANKIVKNGEGSALMKNPKLVGEIVSAVSCATQKPVTVKIRKGYNNASINAVEIAKIAEENGAKAVAVHGRTREQFYSGEADLEIIKLVKQNVGIPVIGSGDVISPETAKNMLDVTGCDAVMIGRGAQGNPWIFKRAEHYLHTGEILPEPSNTEKIAVALRHSESLIAYKGEFIGVREMRKHLCWYIKGMKGASGARVRINKAETLDEIKRICESLFQTL